MTDTEFIYCYKCGSKNIVPSNFCRMCGTRLVIGYDSILPRTSQEEEVNRQEDRYTETETKSPPSAKSIQGRYLVLLAMGLALFFVMNIEKNPSRSGTSGQQRAIPPQKNWKPVPATKILPQLSRPPVFKNAGNNAPSTPILTMSIQEKNADNWLLYQNNVLEACIAQKPLGESGALIMGHTGSTGEFLFGYALEEEKRPNNATETPGTVVFDKRRELRPYLRRYQVGKWAFYIGKFGANQKLKTELARSNLIAVHHLDNPVGSVNLAGSRKTLESTEDCVASDPTFANSAGELSYIKAASDFRNFALCSSRPKNGQILDKRSKLGITAHKLTVRNDSKGPAIVKIKNTKTRKLAFSFYVADGKTVVIRGIPDATYELQFARGRWMKDGCKSFQTATASKTNRPLTFLTKRRKKGNQRITESVNWDVTLYSVVDGNTQIFGIPLNEFNAD